MRNDMHRMCAVVLTLAWLGGAVPVAAAVDQSAPAPQTTPDPKKEAEAKRAAEKKAEEDRKKAAEAARNQPRPATVVQQRPASSPPPVQPPAPVPGYVIGPDDVLSIVYWRDKDLTADVQVRPDGKISLALLNDVDAAGLTPDQLRVKLVEASKEFIEDPNITVVVKTINSRRVFILGMVNKIGPIPLTGPMTVLQAISLAGGLQEYANSEKILIHRVENGKPVSYRFNLKEVQDGKKLTQNILLQPGDQITVP
jgi:polysaccharide export outer membrane protein